MQQEEEGKKGPEKYLSDAWAVWGKESLPRVNTVKMQIWRQPNGIKGHWRMKNKIQKEKIASWLRKNGIHKLKTSAYILWDSLRRGEKK